MPALPADRTFLFLALIGVLLTLAGVVLTRAGAAGSDAGSPLLAIVVAGVALSMFSLVPPAARMLVNGWRRVGIGPRDLVRSARLADGLSIGVWLIWLAGAVVVLPDAWAPMMRTLTAG
ncbi:MAG: hypothetical protein ABW173_08100 [Sphingomonas sp.]